MGGRACLLTVLQHGYFGTRNYGDERSAWAVRQLVRELAPDAQFLILGAAQANLEAFHSDCAAVATRDDSAKVLELARRADVIIYGPGTVLGDEVVFRTQELLAADRPFFIWGAGAWTPLAEGRDGAKVVQRAAGIAVRDRFAFQVVDDVLAGSPGPVPARIADPMLIDAHVSQEADLHGVNISWHLAAREPDWVQRPVFKAIANAMIAIGGTWLGIPASWPGQDARSTTFDNDIWMLDRLAGHVDGRVPFKVAWPQDLEVVAQDLALVDLLITSRLHTGIPVLGGGRRVVYFGQEKCAHMAESLEVPKIYAGGYYDLTVDSIVKAAGADCQPVWPDRGLSVMREFLQRAGISFASHEQEPVANVAPEERGAS
jgi:polysaccharide pyruvyl transferase WcaK-like protein